MRERTIRRVLLAPAPVRHIAASRVGGREAWMLRQSREVRESFVRDVVDAGGGAKLTEAWMLRQPKPVRESYISEVLGH